MAGPRTVSLIASATEIVAALGARDLLIARSHECDFPPGVDRLPAITRPRLDAGRPSRDIDAEVKALLAAALSVYEVDAEALRELGPELVLTQTQCEVCAVSLADVERALASWTGARPRVVSLAPNALADVFADIERVAAALGRRERGAALIAAIEQRSRAIAARTARLGTHPRVACIEWIDPVMAAGNWMPELVAMAGGVNLFGQPGRHAPWLEFDDLVRADPEVILVLPCGFDIPRSRAELPALASRPGWAELGAVKNNRIYLLDGNQYFNRPGPRLADSLEMLAEIMHPDAFQFGHEGRGWVRL
ncbi:MAG: cobalamin-binding protein [Pseudomonadota bacterium]